MWTAVEALQEDAAAATTVLPQNAQVQPSAKCVKRTTVQLHADSVPRAPRLSRYD